MTADGGWLSRIGVALMLLVAGTVAVAANLETHEPRVPPSLAQIVQGNSKISDIDSQGPSSRPAEPADYRIDTGDRVSVLVYQEPDLSVTGVRVKTNGTISYPLLGDLRISGLTSQEVSDLVKQELLNGYLKKPHVTVSIDSYRLYFIKGEVRRPGGYSFVDGLTVAKAVALAGGFTVRASESEISLVRETDPERPIDAVKPGTEIHPGDIITVGESFF